MAGSKHCATALEHIAVLVQLSMCKMDCSHPDDDKRPAILIKDKAHDGSCSQVIWAQWAGLTSSSCLEGKADRSALWLVGSAELQSCLGARLDFRLPSFVRPPARAGLFLPALFSVARLPQRSSELEAGSLHISTKFFQHVRELGRLWPGFLPAGGLWPVQQHSTSRPGQFVPLKEDHWPADLGRIDLCLPGSPSNKKSTALLACRQLITTRSKASSSKAASRVTAPSRATRARSKDMGDHRQGSCQLALSCLECQKGGVMHCEKARGSSTSPSHVPRVLCRLAQLQLALLTSTERRRHRQMATASSPPRLMGATRVAARLMVAASRATVEVQSQASFWQQVLRRVSNKLLYMSARNASWAEHIYWALWAHFFLQHVCAADCPLRCASSLDCRHTAAGLHCPACCNHRLQCWLQQSGQRLWRCQYASCQRGLRHWLWQHHHCDCCAAAKLRRHQRRPSCRPEQLRGPVWYSAACCCYASCWNHTYLWEPVQQHRVLNPQQLWCR